MRVLPCAPALYSNAVPSTSVPTKRIITPPKIEPKIEPDYGKGMKQLSYIISVSVLGVASILLGTRGKVCGLKL